MGMFCYQCQEAAKGTGCDIRGVCGKNEEVAKLQDLLIYSLKGIAEIVTKGQIAVDSIPAVNFEMINSLFMTITNANFDDGAIEQQIRKVLDLRDELAEKVPAGLGDAATFRLGNRAAMLAKAAAVGVLSTENEDVRSLRELIIYGLKGMAAYTEHAYNLGKENPVIYSFMYEALAATLDDSLSADQLVALTLKDVFGLDDINKLPIAYNIAWYEQKAVIVLLALLFLGVKNIHLGPTLPAFLSPNVAKVLVETFGIAGIGSVEDDVSLFMNA
jgi:hydroxylamine reductase